MMTLKQHLPYFGFGLALVSIYTASLYVAHIASQGTQPGILAIGQTLDLVVVVPLLYYGLLIRRKGWPVISLVPVFLLSLFAASFIVPVEHQALLHGLNYLIAPIEGM